MSPPTWLAQAASLPVAFAQVREDPLLDETLVAMAGAQVRVCMIASGGCTVAALAALPQIDRILCVDPNPAQLALARVKLVLLREAEPYERLVALGHTRGDESVRKAAVIRALERSGQEGAALGPAAMLGALGLDHIGRYERLFAALREALRGVQAQISVLLQLDDAATQKRCIDPGGDLWPAIESAFLDVMALPNLVALFGEGATRNPREAFAVHFLRRLRWALETLPARTNPFLFQMLSDRFADGCVHRWIGLPRPPRLPAIEWAQGFMVPALRAQPKAFDLVHLSNILDWLSVDEAHETLAAAAGALRPGGRVIVRQLNSSLDIPALDSGLTWDSKLGTDLLIRDRSFFYREVLVGQAA